MEKITKLLKKNKEKSRVGILALQGNVKEHVRMIQNVGAEPVLVKLPKDMEDISGLIIPGGESTTIRKLMKQYKLDSEIKKQSKKGLPIYGTCAGAILLANNIKGESEQNLNLLDISIKRNAYGRQIESFEQELYLEPIGTFPGVFIRAPIVQKVKNGAQILAKYKDKPVMVRENNLLITTFHPEMTDNTRVHKYFLEMVEEYKREAMD